MVNIYLHSGENNRRPEIREEVFNNDLKVNNIKERLHHNLDSLLLIN